MKLNVNIDARAVKAAFNKAPNIFRTEVRKGANAGLTEIQRYARRNHRFNTSSGRVGSGMLERSVQVETMDVSRGGRVFLDTGIAIYGPRIHRGWGTWRPDQFLYEAAREKGRQVVELINKAIGRAIVKAGLK